MLARMIGGVRDGAEHDMTQLLDYYNLVEQRPISFGRDELDLKLTTYKLGEIRTNEGKIFFYYDIKMSMHEALVQLLAKYPKERDESPG